MKKKILIVIALVLNVFAYAQRFGYVDTEYVLSNLPQYAQAQQRVSQQAERWKNEIQTHQSELEDMQLSFQTEKILLTKEQSAIKEEEIKEKRKLISDLQDRYYGKDGELMSIRRNLVKPIQDQVFNAVNTVAKKRKYSFVFDKGADLVMLYSDPKYDISEQVLKILNPKGKSDKSTKQKIKNSRDTSRKSLEKIKIK